MARTLKEIMATLPPERVARIQEASEARIAQLRTLITAEQSKLTETSMPIGIDFTKKESENE